VYILILPAFGVFSEVTSTFARKRLFGYTSLVWATIAITVLSFVVWVHHFFTMGAGSNVNAFFGIMTMIIAVPTGVKIFTWVFTMYRGSIVYETPIMWTIGFIITFSIGGMTGVLLSVPGADFVLHNSLFLIAHFHNVIIGGAVFGYLAGLTYWFPKAFGFRLANRPGQVAFWCWLSGFFFAFIPSYFLGFMGMTRRLNHFDVPAWRPLLMLELLGVALILVGVCAQLYQLWVSFRNRDRLRDLTGDPWNGRTLEWSTSSPPPFYNFAEQPEVNDLDAYWGMKERGVKVLTTSDYKQIHMPRNTAAGLVLGMLSMVVGFALVWHIWWAVIVGMLASFVALVIRTEDDDIDYYVPAEEVARIENARLENLAKA
jgi:cytochrome o ubiquinol oxidase subunit 1